MFSLTEVASLNDIQPTYRILKPWWDVFMDYIGVIMLMLAIFSGTMQLSKDQVACLPILEESTNPKEAQNLPECSTSLLETAPTPTPTKDLPDSVAHELLNTQSTSLKGEGMKSQPEPRGRKTNLDYQQYIFVNQMCYHDALPWYNKYFPYLALIHTIMLMVSSNFWFKYPKTSSKIEHFVSILGRCFESPWTTKALSETACEDSEENKQRFTSGAVYKKHVSSEDSSQSTPLMETPTVQFPTEKLIAEAPSLTTLDKKMENRPRLFLRKCENSELTSKTATSSTNSMWLRLQ